MVDFGAPSDLLPIEMAAPVGLANPASIDAVSSRRRNDIFAQQDLRGRPTVAMHDYPVRVLSDAKQSVHRMTRCRIPELDLDQRRSLVAFEQIEAKDD